MTPFQTSPMLARALQEREYNDLTPVQTAVLAHDAAGRDILVSAQTGSGKTVAYGLSIAPDLLGDAEILGRPGAPLALIVAPTRELAIQVERELGWLYAHAKARIISCVGGMDARAERRKLAEGVHIVVGTPGRLRDHIERRGLDLSELKAIVLDEADEMLDLGFREDLEFILEATPPERRSLLFSATMPRGIAALARRYQNDALRIEVANKQGGHADIEYRVMRVAPKEIEHTVVNTLRFVGAETALVFCNTREAVRHLQATLLERGFSTVLLSGELSQHERNQSMQALRDGRAKVCVATDVAARGIDLPNLGLVIHAELPHDAEALQHRSGRTGRAGRKGVSVLLVTNSKSRRAEILLRDAKVEASWGGPPTLDDIRKLDEQRMLQDPILTEPPGEDDFEMARTLLAELSPEHLAAALVRVYRARLPAVEDVVDPGTGPVRREMRDDRGPRPDRSFNERGNSDRGPREFSDGPRSSAKGGRAQWEESAGNAVWFRLDIGRSKNADPKWLLPMLCRKGGVTKQDIGPIRIFENETKFQITEAAAEQFTQNMRRPGGEAIVITRVDGGGERNFSERQNSERQNSERPEKSFIDKGFKAKRPKGDAFQSEPNPYSEPRQSESRPTDSGYPPKAPKKPHRKGPAPGFNKGPERD